MDKEKTRSADAGVSRRTVLKGMASGAIAATVVGRWESWGPERRQITERLIDAIGPTPSLTLPFTRRADMFSGRFLLYNLKQQGQTLVKADRSQPGVIVLELEAQAIGEDSFSDGSSPIYPARAVLAAKSRVAVVLAARRDSIGLTVDDLLTWGSTLGVVEVANGPASHGTIYEPLATQTSIEAPWGLVLSPPATATFAHASQPVIHGTRTELWHTRLARRGTFGQPDETRPQTVRAVWAPGYTPADTPLSDPFSPSSPSTGLPLSGFNRKRIVNATSNYADHPTSKLAVNANRLMLSPLGAWLDLDGNWDGTFTDGLLSWRHKMAMGRDNYVRVVSLGYLLPFGHKAVFTTITERRMASGTATLFQRNFIAVRQPVRDYSQRFWIADPPEGRAMPFRKVTITTLVTPNLQAPLLSELLTVGESSDRNNNPFWVELATNQNQPKQDLLFGIEGTDVDGKVSQFAMPLVFFPGSGQRNDKSGPDRNIPLVYWPDIGAEVADQYNSSGRTDVEIGGQSVAFAPSSLPGDTTYPTEVVTFNIVPSTGAPKSLQQRNQPGFSPAVRFAEVHLSAVDASSGHGANAQPHRIFFDSHYIDKGIDDPSNPAGLFARLSLPPSLTFSQDKSSGLMSPSMQITGISRSRGTVAGDLSPLLDPSKSPFTPASFFNNSAPTILGDLSLVDVIASGPVDQAPQITSSVSYPGGDASLPPDYAETLVLWDGRLTPRTIGALTFDLRPGLVDAIHLTIRSRTQLNGPEPSSSVVSGELDNFTLSLLDMLAVDFDSLTFEARAGAKPSLGVAIGGIHFKGALQFVSGLQSLMSAAGLGGLDIDVTSAGVRATYTMAIPNIAFGVFALSNLMLKAGVNVPFDGTAVSLEFDFATPDNPFLLTISGLGGAGWVGLTINPRQLQRLEAALGAAGSLALDLAGVVSGSVSVIVGVAYELDTVPDPTGGPAVQQTMTFCGFLNINGSVRAFGLTNFSTNLHIDLCWVADPVNKLRGTAILTVAVQIAFFSASVSVEVTRTFGSGSDPSLRQTETPADWNTYVAAFAAD